MKICNKISQIKRSFVTTFPQNPSTDPYRPTSFPSTKVEADHRLTLPHSLTSTPWSCRDETSQNVQPLRKLQVIQVSGGSPES